MYNDMSNTLDADRMVSGYGPTSYAGQLGLMSHLNDRLALLSSLPPYAAPMSNFPLPMVNPMPPVMPMACSPIAPAIPVPVPTPMSIATPVPVAAAPSNIVHGIPVTIGPMIFGFQIEAALGPVEAMIPMAGPMDISLQRLAAIEALALNALNVGADGIVDMRIDNDLAGNILAIGTAVSLLPMV